MYLVCLQHKKVAGEVQIFVLSTLPLEFLAKAGDFGNCFVRKVLLKDIPQPSAIELISFSLIKHLLSDQVRDDFLIMHML